MLPKRLMLCGPVLPPVGGISIHIARLAAKLSAAGCAVSLCDESRHVKDDVYNMRSIRPLRYIKLLRGCDGIHIHSAQILFLVWHLCFSWLLRKPAVVTIHSFRHSGIKAHFVRFLYRAFSPRLVFVSARLQQLVGLPGTCLPAYLPPDLTKESELPAEILNWIERQRAAGRKIAVSNAYKLDRHNGQDLYGLDLTIEAMANTRRDDIAFLFVVANPSGTDYEDACASRLIDNGLQDRFTIWNGHVSYARLLCLADASVRATNTDGDALSVRESLVLCERTIASDCIERPDGVILFKNRSASDLASKLSALREVGAEASGSRGGDEPDYFTALMDVYRHFSRNSSPSRNTRASAA